MFFVKGNVGLPGGAEWNKMRKTYIMKQRGGKKVVRSRSRSKSGGNVSRPGRATVGGNIRVSNQGRKNGEPSGTWNKSVGIRHGSRVMKEVRGGRDARRPIRGDVNPVKFLHTLESRKTAASTGGKRGGRQTTSPSPPFTQLIPESGGKKARDKRIHGGDS